MPRAPDSVANRAHAAPYQAFSRQPYQSGQFQCIYQHVEEKEIYQVDNKPSERLKEDLSNSKTYYTNNPYDKL